MDARHCSGSSSDMFSRLAHKDFILRSELGHFDACMLGGRVGGWATVEAMRSRDHVMM